jgi:hypothetical protein
MCTREQAGRDAKWRAIPQTPEYRGQGLEAWLAGLRAELVSKKVTSGRHEDNEKSFANVSEVAGNSRIKM